MVCWILKTDLGTDVEHVTLDDLTFLVGTCLEDKKCIVRGNSVDSRQIRPEDGLML